MSSHNQHTFLDELGLVFFEFAPDPVFILDAETHLFIEVNQAACDHVGYGRDELLKMGPQDVDAPTDQALIDERIAQLKKERVATFEATHIHRSGRAIPVEMNIRMIEHAGKMYTMNICRDVSRRKHLESEYIAREQESRTMIENNPDTIARYDRDCRRIYANPAFGVMAAGGIAALLGKKPSEYPGGPNAELYEEKVREVFASGEDIHFELKWLGKNGKEICSHIRLTAERDAAGKVISVLGVGRDISEMNAYRTELKRKDEERTRFLAAAGHDLRQPLAAANLFIDALGFTELMPEQKHIVQRLTQAMGNFNELLDALLNVSKLDAGMIKPELTTINVADIANWLGQSFAPMAKEKRLYFKIHFSIKNARFVRGDISLIKTVLMNLVSNAIKFTSEGGVLVGARRRGNELLFQVWDSGIGIPEEYVQKIFDEFYQINNPQRDRTRGIGLGLSIAKRALSLFDGEITCRSRPGEGSVFEFRLPVDDSPAELPPMNGAVSHQEGAELLEFVRGKRFVIVEDDVLVAESLTRSLQAMWGEVECYHSAEDALIYANTAAADYYIVDYMLSGKMNGILLLNQLRKSLGKPIIAVMMTGDTSTEFIRKAEMFDWPVLHKPINLSRLMSKLSEQEA